MSTRSARNFTLWGWRDYDRYLSDPQETDKLKQILMMLDQMARALQQGQAPSMEQVIQAFQMVYQTIGSIIGADAQLQQSGTPASEDVALATGGEGNGEQFPASTIPQGLSNI